MIQLCSISTTKCLDRVVLCPTLWNATIWHVPDSKWEKNSHDNSLQKMARDDPTSDFLNYDFMHLTVWHAPDVVTCHTQDHYKRV